MSIAQTKNAGGVIVQAYLSPLLATVSKSKFCTLNLSNAARLPLKLCPVLLSEQTQSRVIKKANRHDWVENTGAESKEPGAVVVGLDAETMVELQAGTDTGPAVER